MSSPLTHVLTAEFEIHAWNIYGREFIDSTFVSEVKEEMPVEEQKIKE